MESPEKMQNGRLRNSRSMESPEKMQNGRLCIPGAWNLQRRCRMVGYAFQEQVISKQDAEWYALHSRAWNLQTRCRMVGYAFQSKESPEKVAEW
jgi:hypothetical protein